MDKNKSPQRLAISNKLHKKIKLKSVEQDMTMQELTEYLIELGFKVDGLSDWQKQRILKDLGM